MRLLLALVVACAGLAPLLKVSRPVADEYVVVFTPSTASLVAHGKAFRSSLLAGDVVLADVTAVGALRFAAVRTSNATRLLALAGVKYVEQNQRVFASQTCNIQQQSPWGLDRCDHREPFLSGEFDYEADGSGVTAVVVDTGINIEHSDFGGRAQWGTNTIDEDDIDGNGHGSHVAGTIGGKVYGLAKKVTLVAVKVLTAAGQGTSVSVSNGVAWAAARHKAGDRTVLNLSLGGGFSQAQNDVCDAAVAAGLLMVVAAGNENQDACNTSPASASRVLSVGATQLSPVPPTPDQPGDEEPSQRDTRASFSNFGTCVSLFAPGAMITSTWKGSVSAINTISGTSMASPHVAGVAAAYWSARPAATNADIQNLVLSSATDSIIDFKCTKNTASCSKSPNKLLHMAGCLKR